jgi:undecaprenyl-diphosphatase
MTLFQSIVLGIVQGITEFVPVSSSGHLVLTPYFLRWEIPANDAFIFNVLVQLGTLLAVFAYFWRDLLSITSSFLAGLRERRPFGTPSSLLGWYLILATIPAALTGLMIKDTIERAFNNPVVTAFFLLGTAILLLIAERVGKRNRCLETLSWRDAMFVGFFQILALFPGISRSGATITGGMLSNLDRQTAARFSFLMSVPIMLAAGLIAFLEMIQIPGYLDLIPPLLTGFFTAAVVGYVSIHWLLRYLAHSPLYVFAAYCGMVGFITIVSATVF